MKSKDTLLKLLEKDAQYVNERVSLNSLDGLEITITGASGLVGLNIISAINYYNNYLAKKRIEINALTFTKPDGIIKDIYVKNESEKQYVDKLCKFDVLVIDDLGATRMSEWETSVLDTLIANRYNSKKHTIFSSNLAFLDSNLYKVTSKDQVLDYKIGERNISRIFEMCSVLEMKGKDYRKKNRIKK